MAGVTGSSSTEHARPTWLRPTPDFKLRHYLFFDWSIVCVAAGSATFLGFKLAWVGANEAFGLLPPYLSYMILHAVLLLIGWFFHSLVSFRQSLGLVGFFRYSQTVFAFKALDFLVFSVLAYAGDVASVVAVLTASAILFLLRFLVLSRFVFAP